MCNDIFHWCWISGRCIEQGINDDKSYCWRPSDKWEKTIAPMYKWTAFTKYFNNNERNMPSHMLNVWCIISGELPFLRRATIIIRPFCSIGADQPVQPFAMRYNVQCTLYNYKFILVMLITLHDCSEHKNQAMEIVSLSYKAHSRTT